MPKRVLFVCIENSSRSQMAEGFAKYHGAGKLLASSAGTEPAEKVAELAVAVMRERGIDISHHRAKKVDDGLMADSDMVITMGCCAADDLCPVLYHGRKVDWEIPDPRGGTIETYRKVRDIVEGQVRDLIKDLKAQED